MMAVCRTGSARIRSDFVRCGSFRVRDPGLISIIAAAEKDRPSNDASAAYEWLRSRPSINLREHLPL